MARTPSINTERPRRVSVVTRNRLSVPNQEAGYVYRIVNDQDDRIDQLKNLGYEIVSDAKVGDNRVNNPSSIGSVATVSVGGGMRAVVMRQKQEWYQEDQLEKQVRVDQLESTMKQKAKEASNYGQLTIDRG